MKTKNEVTCVLALLMLVCLSCTSEKADVEQTANVLAKVRAQALKDLIDRELLYQQGLKLGLDKDAKYQDTVKVMKKRLQDFERAEMARRVASTRIAATVNVTNEEVSQYIDVNAERLKTEFHLVMVQFSSENEAKESLSRIRSGATFESVARGKLPRHQNAGKATGDLGYLPWHQIPFEWREAVEKLGKREVSGALQGKQTGFCIVKLVDRRMNPKADLSSMRAGIMNRLRDEKIAQAYEAYINSLRNEAKIILQEERRTSLE